MKKKEHFEVIGDLFKKEVPKLRNFLWSRVRRQSRYLVDTYGVVEGIIQKSFERLLGLAEREMLPVMSDLTPYLYITAKSVLAEHFRAASRAVKREMIAFIRSELFRAEIENQAEMAFLARSILIEVCGAERFTLEARMCFALRFTANCTQVEIARALNIPLHRVRENLDRILNWLKGNYCPGF